eukprot:gene2792-3584_t
MVSRARAYLSFQTVAEAGESPNASHTRTYLPNGWNVAYVSRPDIPFLYNEIFLEQAYFQHGITLEPDSIVVDVGANIGLFGMLAVQSCPAGAVVCVEPIPEVHRALQANLEWIKSHSRKLDLPCARFRALNCGVSNGRQSEVAFTFYRGAAGWSSMCPDDGEVADAVQSFVKEALPNRVGMELNPLTFIGQQLARSSSGVAQWIIQVATDVVVRRILGTKQSVVCPLLTLSEIIAQEDLSRIDLLKVDVERAELEVLEGIRSADWELIQQVVMEVHDLDGNLEKIVAILNNAGFEKVITEQPGTMKDSTLWNLYARRAGNSGNL